MKTKKILSTTLTLLLVFAILGLIVSLTSKFGKKSSEEVVEECEHTLENVSAQSPTCTEDGWYAHSYCTECGYTNKQIDVSTGHTIVQTIDGETPVYVCSDCAFEFFVPDDCYVLNGSSHEGMTGDVKNHINYTVTEGTDLPIINDGHYEVLKTNSYNTSSQAQIWIPADSSGFGNFSSENNALGVVSFKINTNVDEYFEIYLVEGYSGERWSDSWCIKNPLFSISAHGTAGSDADYDISGISGITMKRVIDTTSEFTGWIDVQIFIELDKETDSVICHYYLDGKYMVTESVPLTTINNSVVCLYINCRSTEEGRGYMIDDLVFGFTTDPAFDFN